ncbi:hypothetical protein [Paracoccus mutanolyticus]|uniref:hypothetical protein n=1 Tax=Paracoccus mutanolyticus TaxID=1499308 RepID=UPI0011AE6FFD|nr:hypothetical protein [Paracoccus mutanolyticus]
MGDEALPAARSLMRTRPEVILYGCTSGSFIEGSQDIPIRIACETDTHCLTTDVAVHAPVTDIVRADRSVPRRPVACPLPLGIGIVFVFRSIYLAEVILPFARR